MDELSAVWATALDHAAARAFEGSPYLSQAWHLWGLTTEGQLARHLPPDSVRMQSLDFWMTGKAEPLAQAAEALVQTWRAERIRARLDGVKNELPCGDDKPTSQAPAEHLDLATVEPSNEEVVEAVREEVFNGAPVDWHALAQYSNLSPMQAARAALYIDPFRWPDANVHAQGPMLPAKYQEQARLEQRLQGLQGKWSLAQLVGFLAERAPAGMRAAVDSRSLEPEQAQLVAIEAVEATASSGRIHRPVGRAENILALPIRRAIEQAGVEAVSAVYVALRELALQGTSPFTGLADEDGLHYTDDRNKPAVLTKNALRKRLNPKARGRPKPPGTAR